MRRVELAVALVLSLGFVGGLWGADTRFLPLFADGWAAAGPEAAFELDETTVDRGAAGWSVQVALRGVQVTPLKTDLCGFLRLELPNGQYAGGPGMPAIPVVRYLFVAPVGATVRVDVTAGPGVTLAAAGVDAALPLAPVQLPVPKIPGARQRAPFVYDAQAYAAGQVYGAQRATATELGIVRGQRLWLLELWPVQYSPGLGEVVIYPTLAAEVTFGGALAEAARPAPADLVRFVANPLALGAIDSGTNYLIVVAQAYETAIAGYAAAKTAQGYDVATYVAPPGTSNTTIKAHIEGLYGNPQTAPDYVLLVGDTDTIPHWVGGGAGSPDTDLNYVCMDGASDWYPDIAIGRFSVRSPAQLQVMVDKTLYYENGPLADPDYLKRAVFMASVDNYQISEGTHNYVINTYMDPNEYVSDKLYCVTHNATTQHVRNSFNDGRFYGIYSGHGGETSWADGPPFTQSDVNGLVNANMYAFICSFACVTGSYVRDECFMETWVRAPQKGAVTAWGSSVNSYWDEDDILERVLFDAIFDESGTLTKHAGPIYNEAKMRLLAHYGPTSTVRRYFEMYNLLGDPALPFPGQCTDAGVIQLDRRQYACADTLAIEVVDCGLNLDPNVRETVEVTVTSDSEPAGEVVLLTETNPGSAAFVGTLPINGTNAAGVLLVAEYDVITATYIDENNGQGGFNIPVTATADVDCTAPLVANVRAVNTEPRSAEIACDTNEPTRLTVYYGLSCGNLTGAAGGSGYALQPSVALTDLQDDTRYYYAVEVQDEAGNITYDDNGGQCYTFITPEVPDFFTEEFTSGNDLDYMTLMFTPDGGPEFYRACTEAGITALPTDPAGGTMLSLSDDDYEEITLSGGAQVSLYGVNYSRFFVGSNGYITFDAGDTDYTETLEDHFDQPRISALFDDLNPSSGGAVSWKQLADRAAITWLGVPEYSTSNSNTFQIELFFDGRISVSYLDIAADDGLAGLSEGEGYDPQVFFMSNLSHQGPCGLMGDLNCDGFVDNEDIDPFVLAVTDPAGYVALWPNCDIMNGDCNGDGFVDNEDIDPFVALITGP